MVQSVELLLDDATDWAVREQWRALAAASLPSQARHGGASNRPHVTLAVADAMPDELDAPLAAAACVLPLPVRVGALVCFGHHRRVLARLVVPTRELLDLHADVAAIVQGCPGPGRLLEPGQWTAHVTMARNLRDDQLAAALAALGRVVELEGQVVSVRRWDGTRHTERLLSRPPPEQ